MTEHAARARSPLTWDDVREIRRAAAAGAKHETLAAAYGIQRVPITLIVRNKRWYDPDYVPGVDRTCPECGTGFRTCKMNHRYCTNACRVRFYQRERGGYGRRGLRPRYRRPVESRLETPLEHGAVADLVADPDAVDPQREVEFGVAREILADLDLDSVAGLSVERRRELQLRLAHAGLVPSVYRRKAAA